jgi:plastocyanin
MQAPHCQTKYGFCGQMIKKIVSILIVLCFLLFAGCVEYTNSEMEDSGVVQDDVNTSELQGDLDNLSINGTGPKTVIVYLENYEFDPYLVTISTGDTVKWVKKDHPAQIIKSNLFQSPTMRDGDNFSFTFEEPGNYDYQIVTHPWTPGGIVVVE